MESNKEAIKEKYKTTLEEEDNQMEDEMKPACFHTSQLTPIHDIRE